MQKHTPMKKNKKPTPEENESSKKIQEGNKFDKIIQENLEKVYVPLLTKIMGFKDFRLVNLPDTKLQTTVQRETDGLKKIIFKNSKDTPKNGIIHLEFQSESEERMDARMLEYLGMTYRKYHIPIYQAVIFLGNGKSKMNNLIEFGGVRFTFPVYNISDYSYQLFLNSENSEEVVLSILANPENLSEEELVTLIVERLVKLNKNKIERDRFITQLEMLSKKRNLQEQTIKIVKMMNFNYDIKTDLRYLEGKKTGLEKGIEKGALLKSVTSAILMLEEGIDIQHIALFQQMKKSDIQKIQKELAQRKEVEKYLTAKKSKITIIEIAEKCEVSGIFVEAVKMLLKKK